ncbi:hypothetical protein QJS10_CPB13g01402 [Acorus calamus]|uniref:Uncharacterized protein n=1 Tax=Acorus calamus TaxID=4465 RepID=A0AAV9DFL5_ACOCL|nr:hypothetical protein QJS10_CPB13g01402 [Acorus calamus]
MQSTVRDGMVGMIHEMMEIPNMNAGIGPDFSSNVRMFPQVEPFSTQQLDETAFVRTEDVAWVLADKNKRNREQQGLLHRTGRTSFAELRRELASKGEATDRMSVFVKSRQDKSGRAPDEETAEVISQMEQRLFDVPEPEQTQAVRERVFTSVMGPDGHGRVPDACNSHRPQSP